MNLPRLMILGHARHGKDTVCEKLVNKYGFKFVSSSWFMAEKVVRPWLEHACGITYETVADCYNDRHNHRSDWYDAIADYNADDPSRLTHAIFAAGHNIYAGNRNARELHHGRLHRAYDLAVWIDASMRVPPEPRSSCTVEPWMCDVVLDNNGPLEALDNNVEALYNNWIAPLIPRARMFN